MTGTLVKHGRKSTPPLARVLIRPEIANFREASQAILIRRTSENLAKIERFDGTPANR